MQFAVGLHNSQTAPDVRFEHQTSAWRWLIAGLAVVLIAPAAIARSDMEHFGNWVVGSPNPGACAMMSIPAEKTPKLAFLAAHGVTGALLYDVPHKPAQAGTMTISIDGSSIQEGATNDLIGGRPTLIMRNVPALQTALSGGKTMSVVYVDSTSGAEKAAFDVPLYRADDAVRAWRACIKREAD